MALVPAKNRTARKFGLAFDVKFKNNRRTRKMLEDARDAIITPLKDKSFENAVLDSIKERFEKKAKQRDPDTNKPWAPLKPATRPRRTKGKANVLSLVDTGSLKNSLKIQKSDLAKAGGPTGVGTAEIGFKKTLSKSSPRFLVEDIAAAHQFGERSFVGGGEAPLPARPFMGVTKTLGTKLEKLYKLSIEKDLIEY